MLWHRLTPWPDAVEGLQRLKKKYAIGLFSNGDFRLILDMARHAGLPWDFIATADLFKKFKPDPEIYRDMVRLLDLPAKEILMVTAHPFDLDGTAAAEGRTAYIPRPKEYGSPDVKPEEESRYTYDLQVSSFIELAECLGA